MIGSRARAAVIVGALLAAADTGVRAEDRARALPEDPRPNAPTVARTGARDGHLAIHDERAREALARGVAWLDLHQNADGSFPAAGIHARAGGQRSAADGAGTFAPVAVTALGSLAFLASGSEPERGPHGHATALAIDWLLARANLDAQSERFGYIALDSDTLSRMHGHGYAALALAQAFAMSPKTERGAKILVALQAAVDCIEKSQGIDGGWWYEPKRGVEHENSITICAVQALRAAHNSGARVDSATIQRAIEYVSRTQKPDGSFRYALGDPKSSVALTAAAIATLNAAGTYDGKVVGEGYDWIFRRLAARASAAVRPSDDDDPVICPFYERVCLAQALWQHSEARTFDEWWSAELARVLTSQSRDGGWTDARYGDVYATAMSCLFLALPEGLLPIFQR